MLDEYLAMLEEAKKRDHRKIGKEMDLFMFSDTVGKGLPMWLPKGTALRLRLQEFLRRIQARYDYQEVITPRSVTSCCISLPATMQNMVKIRSSLFIRPKKERSTS